MEGYDSIRAGRSQAVLTCVDPMMPGIVVLDYNPQQISIEHSTEFKTKGTTSTKSKTARGSTGSQFRKSFNEISLGDLVFTGMDTKARCDTLLAWATPGGNSAMAMAGSAANIARRRGKLSTGPRNRLSKGVKKLGMIDSNLAAKMPMLLFTWGPPMAAFVHTVMMKKVGVTYTRFTKLGIPIRAKVTVRMVEQPNFIDTFPTNPTSGGPPGRSGHVVTGGESLQSIAHDRYGSPGAWRELAAANGIDDPLRVRPGRVVYLPHPGEETGGR
ncbi:hypothetical protein [Lentzea sp. NPDC059081]|uniref:CIS tube protein n=1 Tax=Lentzea sp. NPDC059081 TaxID=3346719 RepID=UPI0036BB07C5